MIQLKNGRFSLLKNASATFLLLVIPVIIFLIGMVLRKTNGAFSTFAIDPEFSYLYSGVLLGQGKINLFIDHPGTPLIVLAALVSRLVHLFRPGSSFAEDVLQNPDLYLNAINIAMISLIAVTIFLAGWWIYRKSGNLPVALFLQFSPFIAEAVFSSIERYMPEPWYVALVVLLSATIMLDVLGKLEPGRVFRHRAVIYGIIIGFGTSLKFTFAPFFVAPLFLLGGLKNKGRYLLTMLASFLVFTFPLIKRGRFFYDWIKSIFLHSGKYGSGDATVLDPDMFFTNLRSILQNEKHFVFAIAFALIILLLCLIPPITRRIPNRQPLLALGGITVALILGILAISKHFAFYYLVPYSMLVVFIIYLGINVLMQIGSFRKQWLEWLLYATVVAVMLSSPHSLPRYREYLKARERKAENKQMMINDVNNLNLAGALILSADNWHIKPEAGLFFGMLMTPGGRNHFGHILNKHYPHTYLFKEWEGRFYDWFDQPHEAGELVDRHPDIIAIIKHYNPGVYEMLETSFLETEKTNIEMVYHESSTRLKIYRIKSKSVGD